VLRWWRDLDSVFKVMIVFFVSVMVVTATGMAVLARPATVRVAASTPPEPLPSYSGFPSLPEPSTAPSTAAPAGRAPAPTAAARRTAAPRAAVATTVPVETAYAPAPVPTAVVPQTTAMSGRLVLWGMDLYITERGGDSYFYRDNLSVQPRVGEKAECAGANGYDDIAEGSSVTVYSSDGRVIGVGGLNAGVATASTMDSGKTWWEPCTFTFTVRNLPLDNFYQLEISHRGKITVSRQEMNAVGVTLGT
jgi:hypothetical protein